MKNNIQKQKKRRTSLLTVAAFITALAINVLGILIGKGLTKTAMSVMQLAAVALVVLPFIMMLTSSLRGKRFTEKFNSQKVAERNSFFISHRDAAEKTAAEKLVLLSKLITKADIASVAVGLCGAFAALFSGMGAMKTEAVYTANTPLCLAAMLWILCALGRIRFKPAFEELTDSNSFAPEEEYPELFGVIRRAQHAVGDKHEIRLSFVPSENVSVLLANEVCIIYIGVIALNFCSEDELYTLMLHEFSHIASKTEAKKRVESFVLWLEFGGTNTYASGFSELIFRFSEYRFAFEHFLYKYAASVTEETAADRTMAELGSKELAASMLLKLKYYELYSWEADTEDNTPDYFYSEPYTHFIAERLENFKNRLPERIEVWNELTRREILSRTATHPCANMRLEALGVSEYRIFPSGGTEAFIAECGKALERAEKILTDFTAEGFDEKRRTYYLDPMSRIEAWEAEGCSVCAETYADIADDLVTVGRKSDVIKLCDRAIETLPEAAALYAYYLKGEYLLRHFDDAGIELIYRAIYGNSNYVESGIELIGEYCCLSGNQQELDRYRENAVMLEQKNIDVDSEFNVLRKTDKLSAASLTDGMLEAALLYIESIDSGEIEKVYLVNKTITAEHSTDAFILKLRKDTSAERRYQIMHSMFRYLDTSSDHQFSLFDYDEVKGIPERIEGSLVMDKGL